MLDTPRVLFKLNEPAGNYSPGSSNHNLNNLYKQVARIIKHLRRELASHNPELAMPTGWMIDNLIYNCPPETYHDSPNHETCDWYTLVMNALAFVKQHTEVSSPVQFIRTDGNTPLFPNHELYDELDAHRFSSALLDYLQQQLHY